MKVFHGSPFKFDKFDYKRIGNNGTSEGFGFYFTDKKSVAEAYANNGYMYTVQLNGKALSGTKRTVKKAEYVKLVTLLHQEDEYLSNYGDVEYEGFQQVLNYAVKIDWERAEDDAALLGGIINACGSVEMVCKAVYKLLGYGYIIDNDPQWGKLDGGQTVYVALVNDVINVLDVQKIEKVEM